MTTFFPLFPNLSKIDIQASDSVIPLKPNEKNDKNPMKHHGSFHPG